MKEYILVILSGICRAVEKKDWQDLPDRAKFEKDDDLDGYLALKIPIEVSRDKAFEGGALVESLPRDVVESFFESGMVLIIDADFNNGGKVELVRHGKYFSSVKEIGDEEGFGWETMTNRLNLKDGVYPIDPGKWEVVEQWQIFVGNKWENCNELIYNSRNVDKLCKTRLTATIKPKEHNDDSKREAEKCLLCGVPVVLHGTSCGHRNAINNGNIECGLMFMGHKRRVQCKKCATPNWVELAKKKPPEDTKNNQAWNGAWLEGEMVGYAKCMVELSTIAQNVHTQEKAKDFDEGVDALRDKLNDEYRYELPVNPYRQDK